MIKARMLGQIAKIEEQGDGTIMVEGIASAPVPDSDGETFTTECMKAAIPEYMEKRRALREMHQPIAAGVTKAMWVDEDGATRISAHVVDPVSVLKVQTGVLKMFSIEGVVPPGGRDVADRKVIHKLRLREVSLVDVGANPEAMVEVVKLDNLTSWEEEMNEKDKVAAENTAKAEGQEPQPSLGDTVKKWAGEEISDAMTATRCLSDLFYLLCKEIGETEQAPDQIADLTAVVDRLKAFIAKEILEDNAEKADGIEKVGARFSKATKEALGNFKKAYTECMKALEMDEDEEDPESDGAKKIDGAGPGEELVQKVAKIEAEKGELIQKIAGLESSLAEKVEEIQKADASLKGIVEEMRAKGYLRTVEKAGDNLGTKSTDHVAKAEGKAEPSDPLDAIRMVHASGGTIINPAR